MKIVIDIDEKKYKSVMLTQNRPIGQRLPYGLSEAIKNGTILPKGHGRLVDADAVDDDIYDLARCIDLNYEQISKIVDNAPTIIEADKESD